MSAYRQLGNSRLGDGRRYASGLVSFYEPRYDGYRYCRPYRHHYRSMRRHYGRRNCGSYLGFGFTTGYPRYSAVYGYPSTLHLFDPAPLSTNIYSTTVYETEPYVVTQPAEVYVEQQGYDAGTEYAPTVPEGAADTVTTPPSDTAVATENTPTDAQQEDTYTLVDEGNIAFNAGDYEAAIRLYVAAVLIDDTDASARLFYGLAEFAVGDYELAAVGMRRALSLDPELISSPIDLRSIYPDAETFEGQLKKLVEYVAANPKEQNPVFLLGYVYFATADPGSAVSVLQAAVSLEPTDELASAVLSRAVEVLSETAGDSE